MRYSKDMKSVRVSTMKTIYQNVLPYCVKSSSNSYSSSAMYHAPDHLLSNVCISLYREFRIAAAFPLGIRTNE